MMLRKCALALALIVGGASCLWALTPQEMESRWNAIAAEQDARMAGKAQAQELRKVLDADVMEGSLYDLWRHCGDADGSRALRAAWTMVTKIVPDGDMARWKEVNYFHLPQEIPRAFMVIDGFYRALIELPKLPGGCFLAAELLKQFSRSPHGRYDFLAKCPEPVALAIAHIAAETALRGQWAAEAVGQLPIARPVDGTVTDSRVLSRSMVYLDGAGIPAANGTYAWDRATGHIYRVISPENRRRWYPDD